MSDDWVLETRRLTKDFRGFIAVNAVDLRVRRGTIHALIGPNGAGKTTIFNLLTRFLPATSGSVIYGGEDFTRMHRPLWPGGRNSNAGSLGELGAKVPHKLDCWS